MEKCSDIKVCPSFWIRRMSIDPQEMKFNFASFIHSVISINIRPMFASRCCCNRIYVFVLFAQSWCRLCQSDDEFWKRVWCKSLWSTYRWDYSFHCFFLSLSQFGSMFPEAKNSRLSRIAWQLRLVQQPVVWNANTIPYKIQLKSISCLPFHCNCSLFLCVCCRLKILRCS